MKKRNAADATQRNVRAGARRDGQLATALTEIDTRVRALEDQVAALIAQVNTFAATADGS